MNKLNQSQVSASQQSVNIESLSEIQNPNAVLNPNNQHNNNQVSCWQRLRNNQLIKLSKKNIIKGIFLILVITLTFWMASSFLNQTLIKERTPFKFGTTSANVQQVAAPDQIAFKSFDYYQKMVRLAKKNVAEKKSFGKMNREGAQEFENIGFWELYGLFKVVKAIQLANGYQQVNYDDQQPINQTKYDDVQNLTAPVNLTKYFNKVADQAHCASCYSFPITATIQYQIMKVTGKLVKLSQQQLIDCSKSYYEKSQDNQDQDLFDDIFFQGDGCNDGNVTMGFQYSKDVGLVQEKNYPYRSQGGVSFRCNQKVIGDQKNHKYHIKSFRELQSGDCKAIQFELVHGNAVATMINVGRMGQIKNYSEPFRDCSRNAPNHAVTIVGQTQNQDWIIRNSWGESWGNNGYFIIKKGNTCGICNHAIVPQIEDSSENKP